MTQQSTSDPTLQRNPEAKLAVARERARRKMPYFGSALHAMTPIITPSVRDSHGSPTFGVTVDWVMLAHPDAIRAWGVDEIAATLIHEVSHLLRTHAVRFPKAHEGAWYVFKGWPMHARQLWNIAADCEINDDLRDAGLLSGEHVGGWVLAGAIGAEDGNVAEHYFQHLLQQSTPVPPEAMEQARQQLQQMLGGESGQGGDEQSDGKDDQDGQSQGSGRGDSGKIGAGSCGSGAGGVSMPAEAELEGGSGPEADMAAQAARSKVEQDRVRRATAEAIRQEASQGKQAGSIPAGLRRWAELVLGVPEVPWQQQLAHATRNALRIRPGAVHFRYDRPSRRQLGVGIGPGRPILPRMVQPIPDVLYMVDTSGSMSDSDVAAAMRESSGVVKAVGGEIHFGACDAGLGQIRSVRTLQEAARLLVGGGGTDFRPPFKAINRLRPRPEVIIYATDGHGCAPTVPPRDLRVIWLLIGDSARVPYDEHGGTVNYGTVIRVKATPSR